MPFNNKDPHIAHFGREGIVTLPATTEIPAGEYYAMTFLAAGNVSVDFQDVEVPLWTGTRTVAMPTGYTLFTDFQIPANCAARIGVSVVLYKYR